MAHVVQLLAWVQQMMLDYTGRIEVYMCVCRNAKCKYDLVALHPLDFTCEVTSRQTDVLYG